ncbi:nucleoside hydrolase [Microbacterium sp. NPDC076911]|uniref:nucleoside hydrolase n=1 Tax=Microbacterium sp. NPDC076911 TaxID=3154958 RepID=UPI0034453DF3
MPMIIDADTGIDDTLALLYAGAHPEIELVGVSTVAGNVDIGDVVHNTLGVLHIAGCDDVEVARGAAGPIARPLETTPETHGPHGIGYAEVSPPRAESERSAVDLIVESARSRPGEITLVTLGPLTNLAAAVLREPNLPLLLRDVFVMGGTFFQAGNAAPRVEWNIHVDPEAARVVFHQWSVAAPRGARPITIMGLDVTETSIIKAPHIVEIAQAAGLECERTDDVSIMATPLGNPVLDLVRNSLRFYFEFHQEADGFYGAHIHDPFVVGAALDPTLIDAEETVVDVQLGGAMTDGETIADWRGHLNKPANAFVVRRGDGERFGISMREVLASLAAR